MKAESPDPDTALTPISQDYCMIAADRLPNGKACFKYVLKTGVRLGFIGEVKNLNILRLPREGELIETTITVMQEIFDVTLVSAEVRVGTEVIATTGLKIAQGEQTD